jgi:hypothetical protein
VAAEQAIGIDHHIGVCGKRTRANLNTPILAGFFYGYFPIARLCPDACFDQLRHTASGEVYRRLWEIVVDQALEVTEVVADHLCYLGGPREAATYLVYPLHGITVGDHY